MNDQLFPLIQLCDSNFPTGAFSHSFGLETYIQEGKVYNKETFSKWLQVYLNEQLVYTDGLACRLVYEALEKDDIQKVWNLDQMLIAQILPRETREGTHRVGERMLSIVESLYDVPALSLYRNRIDNNQSFGHSAIVFTMVAHHLSASKSTAVLYYLYMTISSLVQNAVRGIPLGQTAGQKTIREFQSLLQDAVKKIECLDEDDFGIVSPGLELSQMKHERVNIRIFMS
ncbi:urease accessory protein UreF [Scopulibacillus cellulosilyticus]|uniref:Urease accessory protein UreF n=1 Tax=Scopulibacillus cellulosilyticus TaxID=2665665 RepID=A0ABW2Q093_9BACL